MTDGTFVKQGHIPIHACTGLPPVTYQIKTKKTRNQPLPMKKSASGGQINYVDSTLSVQNIFTRVKWLVGWLWLKMVLVVNATVGVAVVPYWQAHPNEFLHFIYIVLFSMTTKT